ncbi:putative addiction module killer protein [Cupriavidus gilardii J11]|uniref:Putative addiction module killer protein n=1 Tax=Cupriavidus gilardii J11 TaxID=936133 RepID=A0A562B5F7_9BURK|nr:type II toxin-antitoxin system RelE/ParE family toxin [Cupriavidus gilardii]TWG80457.1 putative addiction module killer protein [Cupriavidus gilardii J11]
MINVRTTLTFDSWFRNLRDRHAKLRIQARIDRMELGNLGDFRPIGNAIGELRLDYGPGYRLYFQRRGALMVILMCGGDKSTQQADIERAKALAANLDLE